jgi:hypothetical protein
LDTTSLEWEERRVYTQLYPSMYSGPTGCTHITRTKFSRSKFMYWRMFAYLDLLRSTDKILSIL